MSRIRQLIALLTLIGQFIPLSQLLALIKAVGSFPSTPEQVRPWLIAMGLSDPLLSVVAVALEKLLAPKPAALSMALSAEDVQVEIDEALVGSYLAEQIEPADRDALREIGKMYAAAVIA